MITNAGLNHALNVELDAATQIGTWYVGLIGSTSWTTGLAAADTLASHGGWVESTAYAGNRKEYVEMASTGQSTTNAASVATFVMNATATIKGAFLCSAATGTTGTLIQEGLFSDGDQAVVDTDTLQITIVLNGATS